MTQEELNNLYQSLSDEEASLKSELNRVAVKNAEGSLQPKREDYGEADDQDSYAHEITSMEENFAKEHELRTRLDEIAKAKEKIKSGQYGRCENCSQEIHPDRLKAMPIAALCMDCARKLKP